MVMQILCYAGISIVWYISYNAANSYYNWKYMVTVFFIWLYEAWCVLHHTFHCLWEPVSPSMSCLHCNELHNYSGNHYDVQVFGGERLNSA